MYRQATGTNELGQLPASIGFMGMIDEIIEHEIEMGQIDSEPPHAAGAA